MCTNPLAEGPVCRTRDLPVGRRTRNCLLRHNQQLGKVSVAGSVALCQKTATLEMLLLYGSGSRLGFARGSERRKKKAKMYRVNNNKAVSIDKEWTLRPIPNTRTLASDQDEETSIAARETTDASGSRWTAKRPRH
jgi:hypothetical protein